PDPHSSAETDAAQPGTPAASRNLCGLAQPSDRVAFLGSGPRVIACHPGSGPDESAEPIAPRYNITIQLIPVALTAGDRARCPRQPAVLPKYSPVWSRWRG